MSSIKRGARTALLIAALGCAAWDYDPNNYRQGEIAHQYPQHGAWQVELVAGGLDGADKCMLWTEAGANRPTFILQFVDDGEMLTVGWADTNFTADNDQNYMARERSMAGNPGLTELYSSANEASLSVGGWMFYKTTPIRLIRQIGSLAFAVVLPRNIAWDVPNREGEKEGRTDTATLLDRIGKGPTLEFRDAQYRQSIPLAGFADGVNDLGD
jgi:hypothetical protein